MMKRLCCLLSLLLPLTGCALFEDCVAFSETEWHKFTDDPAPCAARPTQVRACDGSIIQAGSQIPAQTAEPPR
jgi:hypothetical protein